jgi:dipeptidyl aminopeptidase/acylaminoacyl peptidase
MEHFSGFKSLTTPRGKSLEYFLSLPKDFDKDKTYRTMLAIPPGAQTKEFLDAYSHWFDYFLTRNWIMVSPVTPDGKAFFQGSDRYLPYLMDQIQGEFKLAGDKFYLLGVSNGGISSFRVATLHPERFHSITVMPGWPKPADENRLKTIVDIPINFVVGEEDERWRKKSEEFYETLKKKGCDVTLEIVPSEGHMAFHRYPLDKLEKILIRG